MHLGEEEYNANLAQILKGESRHAKIKEQMADVQHVVQDFIDTEKGDPRQGLNLIYNNTNSDNYSEENDAFLMCEMASLGKFGFLKI